MSKWEMVKLGNIFKITSGGTPSKTKIEYYENGNIYWIKTGDLKEKYVNKETADTITMIGLENSSAKLFPKNTVLIAMYGATIGATSILNFEACTNQACAAFLPNDKCIPEYLYYFLISNKQNFIKLGVGGAQPNISATILKDFKIPLPPLDEQKRIAKNLDLSSEIVKGYKTQLEELDKLIQSVFYDMFGDPVTNEKGWEVEKLGDLGDLGRGVSKHRPRNAPELLGGDYPLIQTGEVSNAGLYIVDYHNTYSEIGLKQSKLWKKGTLCITIAANIAKTAILTFDSCFPDSVVGFSSNEKTNQIFIHTWFGFFQRILEEQAPQVAQKNINLAILSNLDVITPPLALQQKFADIVTEIESQKAQVQRALDDAEQLYNSLMQEYFE